MSHPTNKYERKQIGKNKGRRRFYDGIGRYPLPDSWSEEKVNTYVEKSIGMRKDTTKLCSCPACRNQRYNDCINKKDRLTIQERVRLDSEQEC